MTYCTRRDTLRLVGAALAASASPGSGIRAQEAPDMDDMVLIPEGPFTMGTDADEAAEWARRYAHHVSWLAGELPRRTLRLPAYRIDRFPVTNAQFAAFCAAAGHYRPYHWPGGTMPEAIANHPVVFVNRADAGAYAEWAGKRLPTEAEWEKAARGTDGRIFPWGNEFDPEACRYDRGGDEPPPGTAPVSAHPRGASPYGVLDLAGNVAEWCADAPGPGSAFCKGGAWVCTSPLNLRSAARGMSGFDNNRLDYIGFRCAREV